MDPKPPPRPKLTNTPTQEQRLDVAIARLKQVVSEFQAREPAEDEQEQVSHIANSAFEEVENTQRAMSELLGAAENTVDERLLKVFRSSTKDWLTKLETSMRRELDKLANIVVDEIRSVIEVDMEDESGETDPAAVEAEVSRCREELHKVARQLDFAAELNQFVNEYIEIFQQRAMETYVGMVSVASEIAGNKLEGRLQHISQEIKSLIKEAEEEEQHAPAPTPAPAQMIPPPRPARPTPVSEGKAPPPAVPARTDLANAAPPQPEPSPASMNKAAPSEAPRRPPPPPRTDLQPKEEPPRPAATSKPAPAPVETPQTPSLLDAAPKSPDGKIAGRNAALMANLNRMLAGPPPKLPSRKAMVPNEHDDPSNNESPSAETQEDEAPAHSPEPSHEESLPSPVKPAPEPQHVEGPPQPPPRSVSSPPPQEQEADLRESISSLIEGAFDSSAAQTSGPAPDSPSLREAPPIPVGAPTPSPEALAHHQEPQPVSPVSSQPAPWANAVDAPPPSSPPVSGPSSPTQTHVKKEKSSRMGLKNMLSSLTKSKTKSSKKKKHDEDGELQSQDELADSTKEKEKGRSMFKTKKKDGKKDGSSHDIAALDHPQNTDSPTSPPLSPVDSRRKSIHGTVADMNSAPVPAASPPLPPPAQDLNIKSVAEPQHVEEVEQSHEEAATDSQQPPNVPARTSVYDDPAANAAVAEAGEAPALPVKPKRPQPSNAMSALASVMRGGAVPRKPPTPHDEGEESNQTAEPPVANKRTSMLSDSSEQTPRKSMENTNRRSMYSTASLDSKRKSTAFSDGSEPSLEGGAPVQEESHTPVPVPVPRPRPPVPSRKSQVSTDELHEEAQSVEPQQQQQAASPPAQLPLPPRPRPPPRPVPSAAPPIVAERSPVAAAVTSNDEAEHEQEQEHHQHLEQQHEEPAAQPSRLSIVDEQAGGNSEASPAVSTATANEEEDRPVPPKPRRIPGMFPGNGAISALAAAVTGRPGPPPRPAKPAVYRSSSQEVAEGEGSGAESGSVEGVSPVFPSPVPRPAGSVGLEDRPKSAVFPLPQTRPRPPVPMKARPQSEPQGSNFEDGAVENEPPVPSPLRQESQTHADYMHSGPMMPTGPALHLKRKENSVSGDDKAIEKNALDWLNKHLASKDIHIDNLYTSLGDGLNLIYALEDATGESVGKYSKRVILPVHRIDNIAVALNFLSKKGIQTQFLTPQDVEFTEEFKSRISEATNATVEFGVIPREHWSYPTFIDQQRAQREMRRLGQNGVPYGDMMSYHHMCRYYSGFFFRHELLKKYDYYWRIEPDVEFYCELLYDPFKVMKKNNKKYGYVIVATEFMETVPTLWKTTMSYIEEKGMEFPSHLNAFYDQKTKDYNGVHFWSNFEIGDLNWFRGSEYLSYFEYLDRAGGFFYERWGDAPVHSVAAGLLLKEHEMHFFYDIGYKHMDRVHCPAELPSKGIIAKSRCTCDAQNVREWVYRDAPWRKAFDTYMAHIDNVGAQHVGEQ
ncbi:hypothetical protein HK102_000741 [Quaeritorhiza haematococci]|nr:hypothetical protein HK102_000741 [Quaeritorhiza haematococci]